METAMTPRDLPGSSGNGSSFRQVETPERRRRSRPCSRRTVNTRGGLFRIELLESRCLPNVGLMSNYLGIDFNNSGGYIPPDTCGAAGPSSYLETVNQQVAIYSPKATGQIPSQIHSTISGSLRGI
jgi:hypothetical protein